jgi:hypothetical protein
VRPAILQADRAAIERAIGAALEVRAFGVFNEKEKGGIAYPSTFVLVSRSTSSGFSLRATAAPTCCE